MEIQNGDYDRNAVGRMCRLSALVHENRTYLTEGTPDQRGGLLIHPVSRRKVEKEDNNPGQVVRRLVDQPCEVEPQGPRAMTAHDWTTL